MPKRVYSLPPNGRRQLELSWHRDYKLLGIRLDGKWIGMVSDLRALRGQQKIFRLPDDSILKVEKSNLENSIRVSLDGQYLPVMSTSASPSNRALITSGLFVFLIASVQIWLSVNGSSYGVWLIAGSLMPLYLVVLASEGLSIAGKIPLVLGLLYFFLGLRVWQHSRAALAIAITLFSLDTVWLIFAAITTGGGEEAIFILPTLFCRAFITTLLATGFIEFDDSDLSSSGMHPIQFISSICNQAIRAIAIALVIIAAPVEVICAVLFKR